MSQPWTVEDMPDMHGKVTIVTGSNSGIGYEAALALAGKGAHVVLAVRNPAKGHQAAQAILHHFPAAEVEIMPLDLASQQNIHAFASEFLRRFGQLDLLINNAGLMSPRYAQTVDGFELQFGTNHLGHFALTGLLLERLINTPGARVVTISSGSHKGAEINFDQLHSRDGYYRWKSYGRSKLANLIFAYALHTRFQEAGVATRSIACHPGFAGTNIAAAALGSRFAWLGKPVNGLVNLFAQSSAMGALPTLYAATAPMLTGGEYVGPTGSSGMRGYPGIVHSTRASHEEALANRLWTLSEELTGVTYSDRLHR